MTLLTASILMPAGDPLGCAVPPALFLALSYLTLTLHFLAMNFTVGGAILLIVARLGKGRDGAASVRFLATALPLGFSYLVTFGVPPLLFVQVLFGQLFYSSSVLVGTFWILVIPALVLAYAGFYYHKLAAGSASRKGTLVVLCSLALMLFVGFVYVNNLTLMQTPGKWLATYTAHPGGATLNLSERTLVPRYAFFILPGLVVAGIAFVLRGAYLDRWGREEEGRASRRFGARAMLVGAVLAWTAAGGLLATLPAAIRSFVLGGGLPTGLAGGWLALSLGSIACGLAAAPRKGLALPFASALLWACAVGCIVALRNLVRLEYLKGFFSLDAMPVNAQWGMFAVFAVTLVLGLALLVFLMVRIFPRLARRP
ncbi:MAG: hypothetical protein PHU25_17120 [Deltaproteobacteria bacterium]|nr:hypothetical protein [Deltaproteobacteria bacterium]